MSGIVVIDVFFFFVLGWLVSLGSISQLHVIAKNAGIPFLDVVANRGAKAKFFS